MNIFIKTPRYLIIKIMILIIFVYSIYGCGFHLKGWNNSILPTVISTIYIDYTGNDYDFLNSMIRAINATGTIIVTNKDNVDYILQIKKVKIKNQLTHMNGLFTKQYIVSISVFYQLLNNKGRIVIEEQSSTETSLYSHNAILKLNNDNQKQQMYSDLKNKVSNNIIFQIQNKFNIS